MVREKKLVTNKVKTVKAVRAKGRSGPPIVRKEVADRTRHHLTLRSRQEVSSRQGHGLLGGGKNKTKLKSGKRKKK